MERLRGKTESYTLWIGRKLSRVSRNPDAYTLIGLLVAWLSPLLVYLGYGLLGAIMIPLSALVDALDGAVARATGKQSRRGEFLDSLSDRFSDTAYFYALAGYGLPIEFLLIGLSLALTISYVRAKGELVGVVLRGVGLMERGDRVLFITLIALLSSLNHLKIAEVILIIMIILMGYTVSVRARTVLHSLTG